MSDMSAGYLPGKNLLPGFSARKARCVTNQKSNLLTAMLCKNKGPSFFSIDKCMKEDVPLNTYVCD